MKKQIKPVKMKLKLRIKMNEKYFNDKLTNIYILIFFINKFNLIYFIIYLE